MGTRGLGGRGVDHRRTGERRCEDVDLQMFSLGK